VGGVAALLAWSAWAGAQAAPASRILGTVASVTGDTLAVKTDAGTTVDVTVPGTAKILKTAPGQKTLAGATTLAVTDIEPGDRVLMLARGTPPAATVIIVNTKADLEALQQKQREEWQLHGVGGIVKSVDAADGSIGILSGAKPLTIHSTPSTIVRRYAPNSVRFSDAQPSTLAAIQPGDQLQARGQKNAAGTELTADEIVTGSFRNIAGLVTGIDASAGTFTVKDWMTKKAVTIHVTADTDLRRLDATTAETIAARLRVAGGGHGGAGGNQQGRKENGGDTGQGHGQSHGQAPEGSGAHPNGGGNDLARILAQSPAIHLADLSKGDAVVVVATSGSADAATAIRVVSGVRPMLEASARGSQNMFSSAWSLGGGSSSDSGAGGDMGGGGTP
jgi:hypothetical protein